MLVVRFRNHKSFMINNNNNKICKLRIHFNCSHHEIHQISFIIIEKISITKAAPIWKNHSYAGCLLDLAAFHASTPWSEQKNKGSKFLKKLWCCVGGEYYKFSSDSLRRRANARDVSFQIPLRWPIRIINSVEKKIGLFPKVKSDRKGTKILQMHVAWVGLS